MKNCLLILSVVVVVFFSCGKEEDDVKPVIEISSPVNLQSVIGLDTLSIIGTVSDDKKIESVRVALMNEDGALVLSTVTRNPNTRSYIINVPYFFNDIQLPSGEYTFNISAFDGENTTREFISISYTGIDKVREGIVVYNNDGTATNVTQLNNVFNVVDQYAVIGNFIGGGVNSYDQQIITSSSNKVSSFDISTKTLNWDISTFGSYTGIFFNDRDVYVNFLNDNINAYDKNGNSKFEVLTSTASFFGEDGLVFENVFLSEQKSVSGNMIRLVTYWIASETMRHQINLTEDLVGLYKNSSSKAVLFGNELGTNAPRILIYDVLLNAPPTIFSNFLSVSLSSDPIEDCVQINSNVYLILQNGVVSKVDIDNISSSTYLNVAGANLIEYDPITNQLIVVAGNTISLYDYSSLNLLGSYTHSSNILGVSPLYNR